VRELEEDRNRSTATKLGHKGYPYVNKSSMRIRLHLPFYVLNGYMHCAQGERMSDVLNLSLRFLPLTNVEICPSAGKSKLVGFIAVNKCQIILAQDFADSENE
jgi:hypothetical protein